MADSFTFRRGQRRIASVAVDSGTVIAIGDMLYLATDDVRPASDFTWDTNLATTQAGFADVFVGIAMHKSASGDVLPVDIDISADSEYQFGCASATYAYGATVGPDKASGNALLAQTLEAAVAASSVARVLKAEASATTAVWVSFASVYNPSANTAAGAIG